MEDADGIMIITLRQIGCVIPAEINSFTEFTPEVLIPACCQALNLINPKNKLDIGVASAERQRFAHSKEIVSALKKEGYREECGYHDFMYPSEATTKKIISFLVERLPQDEENDANDIVADSTLYGQIVSQIRSAFQQTWVLPRFQHPTPQDHFNRHFDNPNSFISPEDDKDYWEKLNSQKGKDIKTRPKAIEVVRGAIKKSSIADLGNIEGDSSVFKLSVIALAEKNKSTNSRFGRSRKFNQEGDDEENVSIPEGTKGTGAGDKSDGVSKPKKESREDILQQLQEEVDSLQQKLVEARKEMEKEQERIRNAESSQEEGEIRIGELQGDVKVASLLGAMLSDVEGSTKKLNDLNDKQKAKLAQLESELEKQKNPLVTRYNDLNEKTRGKKSESYKLTVKIKELRSQMTDTVAVARGRQQHLKQIKEEYEGMNVSANRSVYMQKIDDMHVNLTRQKEDISRTITDMRQLMTERNTAEERLGRVFQEADEMIYTAAKNPEKYNDKDGSAKAVYKGIIEIHTNYSKLIKVFEQIGQVANQLLDIEERIIDQGRFDTEKKRKKVDGDLDAILKQNREIEEKLDALK